jgi:phosphoinositide 3-kinase regulatory subunit, putative
MGNQLSGTAPVQMHPIEYYLSDISNSELISFDHNLGSTRFFKVARVKLHHVRPQLVESNSSTNYSGFDAPSLGLIKVFVINDPTLPLKYHQAKIDSLKSLLKDHPNFLLFNKIIINDKSAILLRQYIKYNLYDRLSTRPFLTLFEKRWIAYQLLNCCDWLHSRGICHGDIKLENILITSSLWLLLTDFATYKPVYLPEVSSYFIIFFLNLYFNT